VKCDGYLKHRARQVQQLVLRQAPETELAEWSLRVRSVSVLRRGTVAGRGELHVPICAQQLRWMVSTTERVSREKKIVGRRRVVSLGRVSEGRGRHTAHAADWEPGEASGSGTELKVNRPTLSVRVATTARRHLTSSPTASRT
jgi:hypothetical protein